MFDRLKESVQQFSEAARQAVAEKEVTEELLEDALWELEQALLKNNVAVDVIQELKQELKQELVGTSVSRRNAEEVIQNALQDAMRNVLTGGADALEQAVAEDQPALILFMGMNGSGKTTTAAKVGHRLQEQGYDIVFAAGDTFRNASIEQLEEHAAALDVPCISHEYEADPAAVIYDAVEHAEKEGLDVVLADTAGRSHADRNLMDELAKIVDVNEPDLRLLVVDALSGNDVVSQAETYDEIGFDGIVLTKVDVDEAGGAALSIGHVTGKPVLFIGTGQDYEDLEEFDADAFVERLLGET